MNEETTHRRLRRRRRVTALNCPICGDGSLRLDYKNVELLRRFTSDHGLILPRRRTGVCARHQRRVARCVKLARHLALLPHTSQHIRLYGR
jgi:small subunit ribosomal protein S18